MVNVRFKFVCRAGSKSVLSEKVTFFISTPSRRPTFWNQLMLLVNQALFYHEQLIMFLLFNIHTDFVGVKQKCPLRPMISRCLNYCNNSLQMHEFTKSRLIFHSSWGGYYTLRKIGSTLHLYQCHTGSTLQVQLCTFQSNVTLGAPFKVQLCTF